MNTFKRVIKADDLFSFWRIAVNGETVELAENPTGLEHIQACLSFEGKPYPYHGDGSFAGEIQDYGYDPDESAGNESGSQAFNLGKRQPLREYGLGTRRGLGAATIRASIAELTRQSKEALAAGDKPRYDALQLDVIRWRKYERETTGLGGKVRFFQTAEGREFDQLRKSIDRALAAIRAKSAYVATSLKQAIRREGYSFIYAGGEEWDLAPERIGPVEFEPLNPDELREMWQLEIMPESEPSQDWEIEKYGNYRVYAGKDEQPPSTPVPAKEWARAWWELPLGGYRSLRGGQPWPKCPCGRPAVAFGHCELHMNGKN